ncbi:MAG: GNAT family N-acetyltransferase, partial [Rhodobacterales bacterium]|nr:GNAT family N-acetyltransferase [Rhodobacterales bacterium]
MPPSFLPVTIMSDQYPAAGLCHIRGHDHSAIMASIDILTEAFRDDPVMVYFSSRSGVGKDDFLLGNIIRVLVKSHMARGEPLCGYYHQGRLIGCALVDTRMSAWRTTLGALRCWRNWFALPFATIRKLAAYRAISGAGVPSGVTHFLVMIAIAPAARGMGHGGEFLRALEAASPTESYWALDTENPANVPLYEHLGYDLYDEAQLDDIRVYKMQKRLFQAACRELCPNVGDGLIRRRFEVA